MQKMGWRLWGSGGGKGSGGRQKNKTKDGLMNIYDVVCVTTMTNKRDSAIHGQRYCLLIWKWPNIIKGGSIKASVIWWYEFQIPGDQGIPHIAAFNMGAGRRRRLTDMKRCEKNGGSMTVENSDEEGGRSYWEHVTQKHQCAQRTQ